MAIRAAAGRLAHAPAASEAGGGDGLAGLLRGRGRGDQPTGTGVIRGRVTAQDTGAPVRRAQVRGTAGGAGVARLATTDAEGRFELRDLPAGQWSLQASKPGFVTQRLGQRRPFETVVPVDLQDGQQLASANFALARGGAITGRVFDDFGDPVANARVQVLRSQIVEGRRRLVQTGSGDETDDTGAFRLYGLAPGDYYVAATLRAGPQNFVAFNGGNVLDALGGGDRAGYAPTYFPGTGNVSEAQRISLGAGEETSVSFGLLPVRTVRISGTVVSASGTPPTNGAVILTAADTDEVGIVTPAAGQIQANGAFTIVNAVPGSYVLSVRTAGDGGGRGRGPLAGLRDGTGEVGILPITVGSEDMTGVTIVTTRGGSIEGTVVFEGGATRPRVDTLRVAARPIRASLQGLGGRASQSPVAANGTFTLSSLVGAMTLRVEGLPQQWVLKSVEAGGSDVTDTPLDLKGTEQLTGARITLTDKITEINGTATLGGARGEGLLGDRVRRRSEQVGLSDAPRAVGPRQPAGQLQHPGPAPHGLSGRRRESPRRRRGAGSRVPGAPARAGLVRVAAGRRNEDRGTPGPGAVGIRPSAPASGFRLPEFEDKCTCTRIGLTLTLPSAVAQETAPPRGQRPPRFASSVASTSVVRGRVTSVTGAIIRGAEVRAREVNGRENRLVTTDDTGAYEIRDLVPGSWNITASKTGFITQQYGQKRPFSAAEPLNVGERQTAPGQLHAEPRRCHQRARARRVRRPGGRRARAGAALALRAGPAHAVADRRRRPDRRHGRLSPLCAAARRLLRGRGAARGHGRDARGSTPSSARRPTTPAHRSSREAQRIRLGLGEEQPNVTFSLSPVRTVRVSGTVLSARGGPADASVRLLSVPISASWA